jgi:VanZ family protein
MATRARKPGAGWPVVAGMAALAVLVQLYGLYRVAGPPSPRWFPQSDKVEHAFGFALPVALVLVAAGLRAAARGGRLPGRVLSLVLVGFAAHGVVSELVQHFFYSGRTGDPFDVLADWTGALLGALAAWRVLPPGDANLDPGPAPAGRARVRAR